jgi:energy-coupling factor transporter ATP-binding protein EcfA2
MISNQDQQRAAAELLPAERSAPSSVEETGLPFLFLIELIVKVLFLRGQIRLPTLSAHVKLKVSVLEPLITFMRSEKLCEVGRSGASGTDADLCYQLSEGGRLRAAEYMRRNAYCGPAPVMLADYNTQVMAQSVAHMQVTRSEVARHFAGITAGAGVLDRLGAAMNSGRAIFLHGPGGSGKTYMAEQLSGLLKGSIALPHAIMIEGEVVPFYDPMMHHPTGIVEQVDDGFDRRSTSDARWVQALRPAVLTGGELTLDMLDLQFDTGARLYQAPPHLKANNGIFIIDDLGRQRCSATELMNRWIVPMERHVDYLSLHTGYKFPVPFDVMVVFSSNFAPEQLADGAFLRRIGYKIHIGALTPQQYETVFRQVCVQRALPFCADAFNYLLHELHAKEQRPLLACYPRDILSQVCDLARYEERAPALNRTVLSWAWNNYFADAQHSTAQHDQASI